MSAAFHYFRVPQELWRDRFRKIKEAGFNTVETYVPWNWHERTMPRNVKDYSQCDFDDLKAWLKMAHEEFGLYTIVRPGPFICAEWAGGGYPRWIAKFCPAKYDTSFWLRSNHPEHMKWTKHWYDAVCPVFAEEQLTRKKSGEKGIIMVQLENEYIYFGMESEKKEEVLRDMAAYCTNNGIEVPLFTCVTPEVRGSKDAVISQLFDMDNQYVWWNIQEAKSRIEDLKRQQPNAPAFVCELQGGWFSTVGGRCAAEPCRVSGGVGGKHRCGSAVRDTFRSAVRGECAADPLLRHHVQRRGLHPADPGPAGSEPCHCQPDHVSGKRVQCTGRLAAARPEPFRAGSLWLRADLCCRGAGPAAAGNTAPGKKDYLTSWRAESRKHSCVRQAASNTS